MCVYVLIMKCFYMYALQWRGAKQLMVLRPEACMQLHSDVFDSSAENANSLCDSVKDVLVKKQQLSEEEEEEEVMTKAMPAIWTRGQTLQTSLLLVHWKHEAETVSHTWGGGKKKFDGATSIIYRMSDICGI